MTYSLEQGVVDVGIAKCARLDVLEDSSQLGRALFEREWVVAVVEADLGDLVVEVAKHEALMLAGTLVDLPGLHRRLRRSRYWRHRRYRVGERPKGRASCCSVCQFCPLTSGQFRESLN